MRTASSDSPMPENRALSALFVGRERELAELRSVLDRMLTGHGQVVLLAGEPGIGKTRTAEEFVGHAEACDAWVLWGSCFEWEGAPAYWPWIQVLRTYLRDTDDDALRADLGRGAADLAKVIPELRERMPDVSESLHLEAEAARFRLFDSVATFFRNVAGRRPLVLVLDDLHWADTPSLLLLHFLTQSIRDTRVLVLGTYRNVDVGRQHPLAQTLGELTRNPDTRRLLLQGLGDADIARYIALVTGQTVVSALTETISRETEGNPFFVSEVVRLLEAEGWPGPRDDGHGRRTRVPESIREVIGRRLSRLSETCNRVLVVAAVIGRDFRLSLLAAVSDLPAGDLLGVLDEAIEARVIGEGTGVGEYRFSHVLIQETLYQELAMLRRLRLHGHIAETLEQLHGGHRDAHVAEIAHHYFRAAQAGYVAQAIDYAVQAAERAYAQLGYEEAIAHYQRALQLLEFHERPDERHRCEILLALGHTQAIADDRSDTLATYRQAAAVARGLGDADLLVRAALASDSFALNPGIEAADAWGELLEEARTRLPDGDSILRVKVLARLAVTLVFDPSRSDERTALTDEAVAMARRLADRRALCYALIARRTAGLRVEQLSERIKTDIEIIRIGEASGDWLLPIWGHDFLPGDLLEAGRIEEAKRATADLLTAGTERRLRWEIALANLQHAVYAFMRGDLDEVERLLVQPDVRDLMGGRFAIQLLLSTRIEQGRGGELEHDLLEVTGRFVQHSYSVVLPAYLYAALGRVDEARSWFEPLAEERFAVLDRDEHNRLLGLALLGETSMLLNDAASAAHLYEELLPFADHYIVSSSARHCLGSAEYFLGRLALTAGRWEQAEQHFLRSLEANARLEAHLFVAYTQYAYADMLLSRAAPGDRDHALNLVNQALATARELGLIRLERLAMPLQASISTAGTRASKDERAAVPFGLSPRELDVLRLLVDGRSDREIAAALFISHRTVMTHVANILNKLGVNSRTAAASQAVRDGIV